MKIFKIGTNLSKPKNYSRKDKICSCLCPIFFSNQIERVMVKYEVEPNKQQTNFIPKLKKNQWSTYEYWGEFKQIIQLPDIFSKLNEEDYVIKIGSFLRDNIQMPCISHIDIINTQKYLNIKNKEERRKKLVKIKNI